jgi:uncharacterized protein YjaG (DUF416 family)
METFDEHRLREQIGRLTPMRQTLFAAMVAARMAAIYRVYCQRQNTGNLPCFQSALAFVWEQLPATTPDRAGAERHLAHVMELIPEQDENWGPLSARADDSASTLAYTLRSLIASKPEEAAWAARRAYETADGLVSQGPNITLGGGNEAAISENPLIQSELKQQKADFAVAESAELSQQVMQVLLARCLEIGTTCFLRLELS